LADLESSFSFEIGVYGRVLVNLGLGNAETRRLLTELEAARPAPAGA
jgi:hypothetical protein